jgi:hypothetical protein
MGLMKFNVASFYFFFVLFALLLECCDDFGQFLNLHNLPTSRLVFLCISLRALKCVSIIHPPFH